MNKFVINAYRGDVEMPQKGRIVHHEFDDLDKFEEIAINYVRDMFKVAQQGTMNPDGLKVEIVFPGCQYNKQKGQVLP